MWFCSRDDGTLTPHWPSVFPCASTGDSWRRVRSGWTSALLIHTSKDEKKEACEYLDLNRRSTMMLWWCEFWRKQVSGHNWLPHFFILHCPYTCPPHYPKCLFLLLFFKSLTGSSHTAQNFCIAGQDVVHFNDSKQNSMSLLACFSSFTMSHSKIPFFYVQTHMCAPTRTICIYILSNTRTHTHLHKRLSQTHTHTLTQTAQSLKMKPRAFWKLPGLREKSAAQRWKESPWKQWGEWSFVVLEIPVRFHRG